MGDFNFIFKIQFQLHCRKQLHERILGIIWRVISMIWGKESGHQIKFHTHHRHSHQTSCEFFRLHIFTLVNFTNSWISASCIQPIVNEFQWEKYSKKKQKLRIYFNMTRMPLNLLISRIFSNSVTNSKHLSRFQMRNENKMRSKTATDTVKTASDASVKLVALKKRNNNGLTVNVNIENHTKMICARLIGVWSARKLDGKCSSWIGITPIIFNCHLNVSKINILFMAEKKIWFLRKRRKFVCFIDKSKIFFVELKCFGSKMIFFKLTFSRRDI